MSVKCKVTDGLLHVSVQDEDIGISHEDQQFIFDRFYRVESETMKATSGFGIVLYFCKEIIARHGGTIGVVSATNSGSKF